MEKIVLVANNVFRAIFHRRILYLWIAAMFLLILRAAPALLLNFGNQTLVTIARRRALSGALDTWSTLCIALAIFMGAGAISSEVNGKTIVAVLARPIRRWEFLVGKWVGIQCFALISLGLGLLLTLGLARYLDADVEYRVLGLSVAQTAVAIALYSGLAIAMNTMMTPGLAGALTVLVVFLPGFVTYLAASPDSFNHTAGVALDYAVPPGYTSHYRATIPAPLPLNLAVPGIGRGSGRGAVPPFVPTESPESEIHYWSEIRALLQNVGYTVFFFIIGCLVFSRRDLRLS